MAEMLEAAVDALNARMGGRGFDGTARFDIAGEGSVMIDAGGARVGEGPADVTMSASADTFRDILDGTLNPTSAFMSGRLQLDGDMGAAMRLASVLG